MNCGIPATFIRTQGCNLRCDWCDTEGALSREGGEDWSVNKLVTLCRNGPSKLVVITGGEPTLQKDFDQLVRSLKNHRLMVTVETNCTVWRQGLNEVSLITMSPKLPSSGEHWASHVAELIRKNKTAKELKWVISDQRDFDTAMFNTLNWWPPEKRREGGLPQSITFQPAWGIMELDNLFDMWMRATKRWPFLDTFPIRILPQIHKVGDMR